MMSFNNLLNQILGMVQRGSQSVSNSLLDSFTGGALTVGLTSVLMKKENTQELAKAGSVVALSHIAYKDYQNWQQNRNQPKLP